MGTPSTSTLHAPQLARLQLRLVPVSPALIAITSQRVVRASYSAAKGFPLMRNVDFSCVMGEGSAGAAEAGVAARKMPSPPTAVRTTPDPAAFRKFLRE